MKLWTYHPSTFRLDDPNTKIDPTRGMYWKDDSLQYRKVLPRLQQLLGTDQFLWCCTTPGRFMRPTEEFDLAEWELAVPTSEILAFHRVPIWEDIVYGRGSAWDTLVFVGLGDEEAANTDVGAWIRFPLKPDSIIRFEPVPPLCPKSRLDRQRTKQAPR